MIALSISAACPSPDMLSAISRRVAATAASAATARTAAAASASAAAIRSIAMRSRRCIAAASSSAISAETSRASSRACARICSASAAAASRFALASLPFLWWVGRPRLPWRFVVGYGLAQPVFPAALVEPAIPLAKVIILLRSAGWYALAPLLVYSLWAGWRTSREDDRRLILWAAGAFWAWALISALRGGGDMTDNPRYRVLLLPLAGLAVGWSLDFARRTADRWLWRILAVEGIFLAVFLQWYLSRYLHLGGRLSLPAMGALIAGLSALVLVGGWVYDRLRPPRPSGG